MVNDLKTLLTQGVADAPPEAGDLDQVLRTGRSRVRRRRFGAALGAGACVLAVTGGTVALHDVLGPEQAPVAADPTVPGADIVGPTLHLGDAEPAVAGRDYDVLLEHTNQNLQRGNGQYYDGVTTDGWAVFSDGPHGIDNLTTITLVDSESGEELQLPKSPAYLDRLVEATEDRLVYLSLSGNSSDGQAEPVPAALILDRATNEWTQVRYPGLPDQTTRQWVLGSDDRLYVTFEPAGTDAKAPVEGEAVPVSPDTSAEDLGNRVDSDAEEVDDAGEPGESYDLWSVSVTDPSDVRDEQFDVGTVAFGGGLMAWTATSNGLNDRVFVRDLATGEEHSFDPRSGANCNLLGLGILETDSGAELALSQYCGTYDGVRDDRVQVLTESGDPVVTVQGDMLDGAVVAGSGLAITSYDGPDAGWYYRDTDSGRLLRFTDSVSIYDMGIGPAPAGYVIWDEPVNERSGSHQTVARLK